MCDLESFNIDLRRLGTDNATFVYDLDNSYFEAMEPAEITGHKADKNCRTIGYDGTDIGNQVAVLIISVSGVKAHLCPDFLVQIDLFRHVPLLLIRSPQGLLQSCCPGSPCRRWCNPQGWSCWSRSGRQSCRQSHRCWACCPRS